MKQVLYIIFFTFFSTGISAQDYKEWDHHDITSYYEKKEITLDYNSLDKDGNELYNRTIIYFVPTKIKDGVYEVEVNDKISSKLWQIKGTNTYILFRYNPYLYKYDEGILEVSYSYGIFYKKP